jgi:hypothetical protein
MIPTIRAAAAILVLEVLVMVVLFSSRRGGGSLYCAKGDGWPNTDHRREPGQNLAPTRGHFLISRMIAMVRLLLRPFFAPRPVGSSQ